MPLDAEAALANVNLSRNLPAEIRRTVGDKRDGVDAGGDAPASPACCGPWGATTGDRRARFSRRLSSDLSAAPQEEDPPASLKSSSAPELGRGRSPRDRAAFCRLPPERVPGVASRRGARRTADGRRVGATCARKNLASRALSVRRRRDRKQMRRAWATAAAPPLLPPYWDVIAGKPAT
jgi:hypothetical protein